MYIITTNGIFEWAHHLVARKGWMQYCLEGRWVSVESDSKKVVCHNFKLRTRYIFRVYFHYDYCETKEFYDFVFHSRSVAETICSCCKKWKLITLIPCLSVESYQTSSWCRTWTNKVRSESQSDVVHGQKRLKVNLNPALDWYWICDGSSRKRGQAASRVVLRRKKWTPWKSFFMRCKNPALKVEFCFSNQAYFATSVWLLWTT